MIDHRQKASTKLYRDTKPFQSESFDIFSHKEPQSSRQVRSSIDKYNGRLVAIDEDLTMNVHSKHLEKSKALESLNSDLEAKIEELDTVMAHRLSVAKEGLFSSNVTLDTKQIQLLNSHLTAFQEGRYDVTNPIQASVLVELGHQGLVGQDVVNQINMTHSATQVGVVNSVSSLRDSIQTFKSDLNTYNKAFDHAGADKIKASQYSSEV